MRTGLWAGLLGGTITTAAIYLGLFTGGTSVIAMGLWERTRRLIPLELLFLLIVDPKVTAKPPAFWFMLGTLILGLGALGWVLWSPTRQIVRTLMLVWAAAAVLLAILAIAPAFEYYSAFLAAEGDTIRPAVIVLDLVAAIGGYALLFALPYGLIAWVASRETVVESDGGDRMTRREVLTRVVVFAAASAGGALVAHWIRGLLEPLAVFAQSIFTRIKGLPTEITPSERFYIVSKNPPGFDPTIDIKKWSLEVGGLVARPQRFTYEALRAMPAVDQLQTLECISNDVGGDLISTARWRGVRLRDVLLRAGGPSPTAVRVTFRCADGYSEAHPMDDALNPTTLLAYEMNGAPLTKAHGFPLRLLVPGLYGMKNPKWITKIEVVSTDFTGYWEASGWSDEAVVKTMSEFTTRVQTRRLGQVVEFGGVAYGGDRGIQVVEYSTDGGKTWQRAEVNPALGPFTWVLWASLWKPTAPGEYTLKARAIDGKNVVQISRETATLPDGASGYHTIRVRILK
jgi:DMSO/TMAO reductase YedYZ molybdopterin-dependent catalytic subunit